MPKHCKICGRDLTLDVPQRRKYCINCCPYPFRKKYYKNHTEESKERTKQWQLNNPNKVKSYQKKAYNRYKQRYPEKITESMSKSYHNHKDEWRIRGWTNRHKKEIYALLGKQCIKCSSTRRLEIHHLSYDFVMDEKGKIILEANLCKMQVMCFPCHRKLPKRTVL
jgi:hypothetical protein